MMASFTLVEGLCDLANSFGTPLSGVRLAPCEPEVLRLAKKKSGAQSATCSRALLLLLSHKAIISQGPHRVSYRVSIQGCIAVLSLTARDFRREGHSLQRHGARRLVEAWRNSLRLIPFVAFAMCDPESALSEICLLDVILVWLKIKELGFDLCFHFPRCHLGTFCCATAIWAICFNALVTAESASHHYLLSASQCQEEGARGPECGGCPLAGMVNTRERTHTHTHTHTHSTW